MRSATFAVRLTEEPSGSCASRKKAPWSSSGRKPGRRRLEQPADRHEHRDQRHERQRGPAHEQLGHCGVAVARQVDRPQDVAHQALVRAVVRLEEHRAERGREGQRVDRRDHHRHRHGDRELLVELAGDAGDEGHRDEHRQQHHGDGEDRRGDLAHGLLGRLRRARSSGCSRHDALDVLDHHDRVVDDDADGEHQREQRHHVEREPERQHDREGADQGHRHRDQRDQRRAQVAEEQVDDDHDQDEGLDQRVHHLADALLARSWSSRRSPCRRRRPGRRPPRSCMYSSTLCRHVERVGARRQEDGDKRRPARR